MADVYPPKIHTFPPPYSVGTLPKIYIAFVDLIHILDNQQQNLMKIFEKIVEWANSYSSKHPGIISNVSSNIKRTRQSFLNAMIYLFDEKHTVPKLIDVKLPSGKVATVPTFDFEPSVFEFRQDDKIISANLCQESCDKHTWMQNVPIQITV